jgi:hypothetical protein
MTKKMDTVTYGVFKNVFNRKLFQDDKAQLLKKVARYPDRYIGLFRPTKPKIKLIQNLTQSHEIRFGDAFEEVLKLYFERMGYTNLPTRLKYHNNSSDKDEDLYVDQIFSNRGRIWFIEQKVRDDHDSTKKRGQISNFERKLEVLIKEYGESICGIFYFIDPSLQKNKNYYWEELGKLSKDYGVELKLFYGKELFTQLGCENIWDEILSHLRKWKKELPDFPEINFDLDAVATFNEIKDLSTAVYRKLFDNNEIYQEIVLTLFPEGKTLRMLWHYFEEKSSEQTIYKSLKKSLDKRIRLT